MKHADCLQLKKGDDAIYLILTSSGRQIADGERRFREATAMVRRTVRKVSGVEEDRRDESCCFRLACSNEKTADALALELRPRIEAIFNAPLTPKAVDRVLGITPSERIQWYKDGRLPNCGNCVIGRGAHKIRFPLFPVDAITRLAAEPQIIEKWRREDQCPESLP